MKEKLREDLCSLSERISTIPNYSKIEFLKSVEELTNLLKRSINYNNYSDRLYNLYYSLDCPNDLEEKFTISCGELQEIISTEIMAIDNLIRLIN